MPKSLPNIVTIDGRQVRSSDDGVVIAAQRRHPEKVTAQPSQHHRQSRFLVERDLSVQTQSVKLNTEVLPTSPPQDSEENETYCGSMLPSRKMCGFHDWEIRRLASKALDAHLRRSHAHEKVMLLGIQNASGAVKQNLLTVGTAAAVVVAAAVLR